MRSQAVIRGLIVLAAGVLAGSAAAADGSGAGSERTQSFNIGWQST